MEKIDMSAWPRREIFKYFSTVSQPFYSVSFTVDVTGLLEYTKREKLSFYYALTYLVTKAVNNVEAFRYAQRQGELILLDGRDPSFTDMKKGSDNFYIVTLPLGDDIKDFCRRAKERSLAQSRFLETESESNALIYISSLPWLELTALTNERDFDADDSVPRISWGKYYPREGRTVLGMSVEVNHRFVDGVHIGKMAEALEREIAALP